MIIRLEQLKAIHRELHREMLLLSEIDSLGLSKNLKRIDKTK